jgi:hypothetical protein
MTEDALIVLARAADGSAPAQPAWCRSPRLRRGL